MQVILAQPRGFCAGVVRAIDIVERALTLYGPPVYVRHEIVHNRHVVERLERMGARFVEELAEVPAGAHTIFSAHGVSKAVEADAAERGLAVLDATCPLVAKVHIEGKRYVRQGRQLILIGHAGHPEVEGTRGQIDGPVYLVQNVGDVATLALADDTPLAFVTQTTLSVDDTRAIIAALRRRFTDLLSKLADVILVVGASNSSNSNRLREIGLEEGVPSYLVGSGAELDPSWVEGAEVVGITAGASAPEALVEDLVETLRRSAPVEVSLLPGIVEDVKFRLPSELLDA